VCWRLNGQCQRNDEDCRLVFAKEWPGNHFMNQVFGQKLFGQKLFEQKLFRQIIFWQKLFGQKFLELFF
jgi:hypothetical protein